MTKPGRNDPCPCGSGRKYKKCCGQNAEMAQLGQQPVNDLMIKAQAMHRRGRLQEAERLYQDILRIVPRHAAALHYAGLAAFQCGEKQRGLPLLAKSVDLEPSDPEFQNNYGYVLSELGKDEEAIAHYQQAIKIRPGYAEAHFNCGNSLLRLKRNAEAIQAYRVAIDLNSKDASFFNNLANAYLMEGAPADAIACYESAIFLNPLHAEAYNNLGNACRAIHDLDKAVSCYEKAIALNPQYAEAVFNLGNVHFTQGKLKQAMRCFERCLELQSNDAMACCNLGIVHQQLGDLKRAVVCYRQAMRLDPAYAETYRHWASCKKAGNEDADTLKKIEQLLAEGKFADDQLAELHFALGKIYDDLSDYSKAFGHYQTANLIEKRGYSFDRQGHASLVSEMIHCYSAEKLAAVGTMGNTSSLPVLIVGMMRSGTTLVEQILSSHPAVAGGDELSFWGDQQRKIGVCPALMEGLIQSVSGQYLELLQSFSGTTLRATDKLPANYQRLGLIHAVFPKARIIHCKRNPVDTCLSIYFLKFDAAHSYAYDLEDLAFYYREYQRLMAHWRSVLPPEIFMEVDYEELVENQEMVSRRLVDFCGLEWDERCLEFYKNERSVKTASNWQVRQPMYRGSKNRWRNYSPYIGPLLSLIKDQDDA